MNARRVRTAQCPLSRCSLRLLGYCAVVILLCRLGFAADRPNIVFMFCDDLRYDCLGCNGNDIIQTPNIDALAARGVSFDNVFVTTAICVTSRANLMTGQYAARTGWRFGLMQGKPLSPQQLAITYPGILKESGYQIGYVGKYHLGVPPENFFDYNAAYQGQGFYLNPELPDHLTAHMGTQAEEALEQFAGNRDRPFLLTVGFKGPHVQDGEEPPFYPYDEQRTGHLYKDVVIPPPPLSDPEFFETQPEFIRSPKNLNRKRWEWRLGTSERFQQSVKGYYRVVSGVDLAVGRVVAKLKSLGLSENTIVLFSSEHGVYLGKRGLAGKWLAHEPSIRIPLIVADPRLASSNGGARRKQMALTIDIAPTLLDIAGVERADRMQGESLVPIVRGESPSSWRTEFFYDHLFRPDLIPSSEAVRTERWKYIRYLDREPLFEELYDLDNDPLEVHNLATSADSQGQLAKMRQKWRVWREKAK